MQENEYLIILYDYYGELLNELQKNYFELYYFDNLSLSEIGENDSKSRNAIHKCIKSACNKLYEFEEKLRLYENRCKLEKLVDRIEDSKLKEEIKELI